MLEIKKVPSEVLVRFDVNGDINGAHVKYIEIKSFEGEVLSMKELLPINFTMSPEVQAWLLDLVTPAEEVPTE